MISTARQTTRKAAVAAGLCTALALGGLPSAGSAEEGAQDTTLDRVQAEFSDAFAAMGDYTSDQREAALGTLDTLLSRIDTRLAKLEARARENWSDMSQEAQERSTAALDTLRASRIRLSETYGAMSADTEAAWEDMVSGVTAAWQDLEAAWTDAADAIGPDAPS